MNQSRLRKIAKTLKDFEHEPQFLTHEKYCFADYIKS